MISNPPNRTSQTQNSGQVNSAQNQNNDLAAAPDTTVPKRGGLRGIFDKVMNFFSNLFKGASLSKEEKAARAIERAEGRIAEAGAELIKGLSKGVSGGEFKTSEVNNLLAMTRNASKLSPENPDRALREQMSKMLDSIPRDQLEHLNDYLVDDQSRERMMDQLETIATEIVMMPANAVNDIYKAGSLNEMTPEPNAKQRNEINYNNNAIFNVIEELRMLVPQHLSGRTND